MRAASGDRGRSAPVTQPDRLDVLCFGEALIDFVSLLSGVDLARAPGFKKAAGGAPANVAVGVCRLGARAGFMGKVGRDPFGRFLEETLRGCGVDVSGMLLDAEARTTLAFVSLTAVGERDFVFFRNPGADMLIRPDEVDEALIERASVFHFGSVSLSREPARSATRHALAAARRRGSFVSFDVNLRPAMWTSEQEAVGVIAEALAEADLVKVNEEELAALSDLPTPAPAAEPPGSAPAGGSPISGACRRVRARGPALILVTLGEKGCFYQRAEDEGFSPGFEVRTVDTTGAGDAYMAAVLAGLVRKGPRAALVGARDTLLEILREANAAGALATTRRGAIPAMVGRRRLEAFLRPTLNKVAEDRPGRGVACAE